MGLNLMIKMKLTLSLLSRCRRTIGIKWNATDISNKAHVKDKKWIRNLKITHAKK